MPRVTTSQCVTIEDDVSAADLVDSWVNGNREGVIDALASDHPGLTALVLVAGAAERKLSKEDCVVITNMLVDRRRELLLASE